MLSGLKKYNLGLIRQIFKFGIVGFVATIIDWVIFYIFSELLTVHYLISAIISFCCSVIFNYRLSIKWVFNVRENSKFLFQKFAILSVIGLGANELILFLLVDSLGFNTMISKIIATIIVMFYNFITRKKFIEK